MAGAGERSGESSPGLELYVMQDGTHADAGSVSPGKDGILRNESGLAVCLDADGNPQTVGSDAVRNMNVEAAKSSEEVAEDKKAEADRAREKQAEAVRARGAADRDRGKYDAPRVTPPVESKPESGNVVRNTEPLAPRKP